MTIKQRQWQLYYLGYYGGGIDGIWGAGSKAATVGFQNDSGLETKDSTVRWPVVSDLVENT